jgi:hypothetical protein
LRFRPRPVPALKLIRRGTSLSVSFSRCLAVKKIKSQPQHNKPNLSRELSSFPNKYL